MGWETVEAKLKHLGRWLPASYQGKDNTDDHNFLVTYDYSPNETFGVLRTSVRLSTPKHDDSDDTIFQDNTDDDSEPEPSHAHAQPSKSPSHPSSTSPAT